MFKVLVSTKSSIFPRSMEFALKKDYFDHLLIRLKDDSIYTVKNISTVCKMLSLIESLNHKYQFGIKLRINPIILNSLTKLSLLSEKCQRDHLGYIARSLELYHYFNPVVWKVIHKRYYEDINKVDYSSFISVTHGIAECGFNDHATWDKITTKVLNSDILYYREFSPNDFVILLNSFVLSFKGNDEIYYKIIALLSNDVDRLSLEQLGLILHIFHRLNHIEEEMKPKLIKKMLENLNLEFFQKKIALSYLNFSISFRLKEEITQKIENKVESFFEFLESNDYFHILRSYSKLIVKNDAKLAPNRKIFLEKLMDSYISKRESLKRFEGVRDIHFETMILFAKLEMVSKKNIWKEFLEEFSVIELRYTEDRDFKNVQNLMKKKGIIFK